jgi:anti-sigma factor RsiW
MWCRRVERRLGAYLDGELSHSDVAEVKSHLSGCDACRQRLETLHRLQTVLGGLAAPAVPEGFALDVVARVRRDLRPSTFAKKPAFAMRPWPSLARAAALTAAVLLGLYLGIASATAGSKMEVTPSAGSAEDPSVSLYAESFDLLPESSPAAQYFALLNEKGR